MQVFSLEKGRANWPLCLDSFNAAFREDQAKRPDCPTLAPRFSFFQGAATRHESSPKYTPNITDRRLPSSTPRTARFSTKPGSHAHTEPCRWHSPATLFQAHLRSARPEKRSSCMSCPRRRFGYPYSQCCFL